MNDPVVIRKVNCWNDCKLLCLKEGIVINWVNVRSSAIRKIGYVQQQIEYMSILKIVTLITISVEYQKLFFENS